MFRLHHDRCKCYHEGVDDIMMGLCHIMTDVDDIIMGLGHIMTDVDDIMMGSGHFC